MEKKGLKEEGVGEQGRGETMRSITQGLLKRPRANQPLQQLPEIYTYIKSLHVLPCGGRTVPPIYILLNNGLFFGRGNSKTV